MYLPLLEIQEVCSIAENDPVYSPTPIKPTMEECIRILPYSRQRARTPVACLGQSGAAITALGDKHCSSCAESDLLENPLLMARQSELLAHWIQKLGPTFTEK